MTFLPKTKHRRLTCLTVGIVLVLLAVYVIFFQPSLLLFSNYSIRFAYMELTKKTINKGAIGNCQVYLYGETLNGKVAEVKNIKELLPVIAEAFNDFPDFVVKKHKINLPKIETCSLVIILVTEKTYDSYRQAFNTLNAVDSNAFSWKHKIYIESRGQKFDILLDKTILRHEVFHFLVYESGLYKGSVSFLPHEDAYEFGNLLKIKK